VQLDAMSFRSHVERLPEHFAGAPGEASGPVPLVAFLNAPSFEPGGEFFGCMQPGCVRESHALDIETGLEILALERKRTVRAAARELWDCRRQPRAETIEPHVFDARLDRRRAGKAAAEPPRFVRCRLQVSEQLPPCEGVRKRERDFLAEFENAASAGQLLARQDEIGTGELRLAPRASGNAQPLDVERELLQLRPAQVCAHGPCGKAGRFEIADAERQYARFCGNAKNEEERRGGRQGTPAGTQQHIRQGKRP
jgi:hypothetical protein